MYQKTLTILLAFVALLSLGSGITGFYTLDDSSLYCSDDSDCSYSVCCALDGETYGVCAQESECADVYEESKNNGGIARAAEVDVADEAEQSYIAVALGLILLMIIAIVSYVEWHQHKEEAPKKRKKRKKSKK